VVVCASYCDRWITDNDFVRNIACDYDLLACEDNIAFDVFMFNKANRVDIRFKGTDDPDGREACTVFRSGSAKRGKVFCYCIGKIGHPPKPSRRQKWSNVSYPSLLTYESSVTSRWDKRRCSAKPLQEPHLQNDKLVVKANPKLKSLQKILCLKYKQKSL
jgi:hypothetical protein